VAVLWLAGWFVYPAEMTLKETVMEKDLKELLCLGFTGDFKILLFRSGQLHCRGDFLKVRGQTQVR